ncbi:3-(3-hydroxy-phenyl)propionate/3-hydroxycinnamic acid hydroxylase [Labeo rohita]|uniref:3-(3-hydroxy-phenyl)propionate/3-hydroxycinnamic acid hydroxylase n=1 Tax=Labeo rohita TaxID=84645 RepID=A0ABQ8LDY2_LABRO|nr:3-(3-hydroxy-phenyl)propionate/3-hydroxycinnamic acid hydroxylase [Labeo rohita]
MVAVSAESPVDQYRTLAYDTALSTLLAVLVYVVVKVSLDGIRQWRARISVLIVGSGPIGLTAALVAVRSGKVLKLTLLDERYRSALLCRPQQIALDPRSVRFLLDLGVDFDNMEGCWHNEHFFTKIGVFQEYLLSILEQKKQKVDVKVHLGTKFSEEYLRKMPRGEWPRVIVVADGSCGDSCSVPTPEIRAHSLYFDLSAYGIDTVKESRSSSQPAAKPGFHLKIYGTFRNRYMALACTSDADSKMMHFLRHTANSSIMKNIFHQSFNAYKTDIEPRLSELTLHHMQCSRKLFEIMLSYRRVSAAYIEGDNVAVTVEGEAARVLNFDTGCGVNLGMRGLESLGMFIYRTATALDQNDVFEALSAKIQHSRHVAETFRKSGLASAVFE